MTNLQAALEDENRVQIVFLRGILSDVGLAGLVWPIKTPLTFS